MTDDHPTVLQQIEAVEWAELYASHIAKTAARRGVYTDEVRRRLEAAAETLRTLEYGRAIAR